MEECKRKFDALVYLIRLYDHNWGINASNKVCVRIEGRAESDREDSDANHCGNGSYFCLCAGKVLDRTRKFMYKSKGAGYSTRLGKTEGNSRGDESHQGKPFEKGELWKAK